MHPPLNIVDQTDEMIAVEWLREHGYNTYAEHMEASIELPFTVRVITHIGYSTSWSVSRYRSKSSSAARSRHRSWSKSKLWHRIRSESRSVSESRYASDSLSTGDGE